jgi:hypothetical protein
MNFDEQIATSPILGFDNESELPCDDQYSKHLNSDINSDSNGLGDNRNFSVYDGMGAEQFDSQRNDPNNALDDDDIGYFIASVDEKNDEDFDYALELRPSEDYRLAAEAISYDQSVISNLSSNLSYTDSAFVKSKINKNDMNPSSNHAADNMLNLNDYMFYMNQLQARKQWIVGNLRPYFNNFFISMLQFSVI